MMQSAVTPARGGVWLALSVLLADQLSKWWILEIVMQPLRVIPVTPFFNLVLGFNDGVTFGLLQKDHTVWPLVLACLALAVVGWLLTWLQRNHSWLVAIALGLIIGGALGNVLDRLRHGAVVDFLDFHWAGWHWPAFNLADSGIVLGVLLLLWDSLAGGKKSA